MRASRIEFRLRLLITAAIVIVGFWSPWIRLWDWDKRISTLEWLALEASRAGLARFTVTVPVIIILGSLIAAVGAWLRIWGAASLGYRTVQHGQMQSGALMADGPYRYVRNPLYLGSWCMMIAMSLAMPPGGALFTIVLTGIFYLRLIFGEEAFLAGQIGEPYQQYLSATPRLMPRLRATLPAALPSAHRQPRWLTALVTEILPIGIFVSIAVLSWRYDNQLVMEGILVAFLLSFAVRSAIADRISTGAFLLAAGIGWKLLHLRPLKAALIALGVALIVHALLPGQKPGTRRAEKLSPEA